MKYNFIIIFCRDILPRKVKEIYITYEARFFNVYHHTIVHDRVDLHTLRLDTYLKVFERVVLLNQFDENTATYQQNPLCSCAKNSFKPLLFWAPSTLQVFCVSIPVRRSKFSTCCLTRNVSNVPNLVSSSAIVEKLVCMYVSMHVCQYVIYVMYVCMYVCIYAYTSGGLHKIKIGQKS